MSKVTSKDGTEIAYEMHGSGPSLILVDGAMGYRALGFSQPLVQLLAPHFTVYSYDRRGRGESTNSRPFAVEREVEDIDVLIQTAGSSAYVYGISSGACLAIEAAILLGNRIKKLALFEPPYNSDPGALPAWKAYRRGISEALSAKRNDDAVMLFMKFVGTPDEMVNGMRQSPMWQVFESVAPTLEYDAAEMGENLSVPNERVSKIRSETLVMDGALSMMYMPFMHATATSLVKAIPNARLKTLEGQAHDVKAEALAPVLIEFFQG